MKEETKKDEIRKEGIREGHFNDTHGLEVLIEKILFLGIEQGHNELIDSLLAEIETRMFNIRENGTGETYKEHKALSDFKHLLISKKK